MGNFFIIRYIPANPYNIRLMGLKSCLTLIPPPKMCKMTDERGRRT